MKKDLRSRPGRPSAEGRKRQYVVADDAHEWIMEHGGGRYITEAMRIIKATATQRLVAHDI